MDLSGLRNRLAARYHSSPQTVTTINHAIRDLETGLAALARLGHPFHLETGHVVQPRMEWPSIWFHQDFAPNGRRVMNEYEFLELGPNWFPTALEAQLWDGIQTQFTGRGGVKRLGTLVALALSDSGQWQLEHEAEIARRIAEFKAKKEQDSENI